MRLRRSRSAQALVMVTFALFAIVGLIGLAVDFGWMYFLEKNMQSAADAAALAAVRYAAERATSIADYDCTGSVTTCSATPTSCASISSGNLQSACLYASANGFDHTTAGVSVRVQASDAVTTPTVIDDPACANPGVDHPPTTGCVNTFYWVTVRVAQQVPQLFSAITGNMTGLVAARATAAVAESTVLGSLILINRENDSTGGALDVGTNLFVRGGAGGGKQQQIANVNVPGGIILASSSSPNSPVPGYAGFLQGSSRVTAPFTNIRDTGEIGGNATQNWQNPPVNSPDSSSYYDPMWQKGGQPPLNTDPNLPIYEVKFGTLDEGVCPNRVCRPGIYYASEPACKGCIDTKPSGAQISAGMDFRFGGTSPGYSNFGDWYFIGGLRVVTNHSITFDPGRYAFLGVSDTSNPVLDIPNGVTLTGGTAENADAGRILITTDWKQTGGYPGVEALWQNFMASQTVQRPGDATWRSNGLSFSKTAIKAGQNERSVIQMFGLKKNDPDVLQAGLNQFTPAVLWQDQRNSYVHYNSDGTVDQSCGTLNSFCANSPPPSPADAPQLEIWATPHARWGGMIYQPRGAWTLLQASGEDTGPLMIVSGALKIQGTANLTLSGPSVPLTVYTVALVE